LRIRGRTRSAAVLANGVSSASACRIKLESLTAHLLF
jgi:hypothetical protein